MAPLTTTFKVGDRVCDRRERLIRFIAPWSEARPKQYEPWIGRPGLGYRLSFYDLTDEALEALAACIRKDFWATRRLLQQNRELWSRAS